MVFQGTYAIPEHTANFNRYPVGGALGVTVSSANPFFRGLDVRLLAHLLRRLAAL